MKNRTKKHRLTIEQFNRRVFRAANNKQTSVQSEVESKSLELLFDYTKFHIGAYLTLSSLYVALLAMSVKSQALFNVTPEKIFLYLAIGFTLFAGMAGGVIASSITQIETTKSSDFLDCRIGPLHWDWLTCHALRWTQVEHVCFWLGLISAILSIVCGDNTVQPPKVLNTF